MKILIICKDIGGYAQKLSHYLATDNEVCFIDTSTSIYSFKWAPKKLRKGLRKWADLRGYKKIINAAGQFDVALFVTPAQIPTSLIKLALNLSDRKVAYLYDSLNRWPMSIEALSQYDKVFSFDPQDVANYGLHKLYNYIYEDFPVSQEPNIYSASVIMSGHTRIPTLEGLARAFDNLGITDYKFYVQCKPPTETHPNIVYFKERLSLNFATNLIKQSQIVIDISRPGQAGLSFRFFEAMPFRKKIITTNKNVANYDFYNPANILIVDEHNPVIPHAFLTTPYVDIPEDIYQKYTLKEWSNKVLSP